MLAESPRCPAKQLKEIWANGVTNAKLQRCMKEEELGEEVTRVVA
jgi:hypothetical protein